MTITQTTAALGSWGLSLKPETPRAVRDALAYFGHVVVSTGRPDPRVAGDSLLTSGRYTGVVLGVQENDDGTVDLSGSGMAFWLGDADKKGAVLESLVTFTASTFTNAVRTLLPSSGAVTEGTLHSVTGTYTGTHQWEDPRTAIDYVCGLFNAEWRVNNNATLDAGLVSDLYVTSPVVAIVQHQDGADMALRALPGQAQLASDVEDFTTRVVLLAQGDGASVATGTADIAPGLNPYVDLHGNPVKLTRMVSESATDQGNAAARAQLALNQFTSPRDSISLSTSEYDILGSPLAVGDYVWVHAPDSGLIDLSNEVVFRGQRLNPLKLRVIELTWPVQQGMAVAYRAGDGTWTDLTDYLLWETGDTTVTVGGYDRSLTGQLAGTEPIGSRPQPNTSIPAAPAFTLPFPQSVYQSTNSGITKAQFQVTWTQPLNTDGSVIIDGDHYEIQYRTSANPIYPVTHAQLANYTHQQLHDSGGTWGSPLVYPVGPWQTVYVGWDEHQFLIQELTPGVPYDIQIRAVDNGTPANASVWSATTTVQTLGDTIAPSAPAAPSVAASRLAIQVTHTLGRSSGGTYNLEPDLHHLEVHAQYEPTFTPTDSTLLGKLVANNGMIIGGIPAVGTFQVESTNALYFKVLAVDEAGNKSTPSTAVQATALLIDDAHISDLTVSKVTAGTITAAWILAGSIKTATSGARMEADAAGLRLYNPGGTNTVNLASADGSAVLTGQIQTGTTGKRMVFAPDLSGGAPWTTFHPGIGPTMFLYPTGGVNDQYAFMQTADNEVTPGVVNPATTISNWDPTINHVVGGNLNIDNTNVAMAFVSSSGSLTGFYEVDSNGVHTMYGTCGDSQTFGGKSAVYCGEFGVGAGFGTLAIGYGTTMAGRINPMATVVDTAAVNTYAACSASSATGFSISYPNLHAVIIDVWCFRLA